MTAKDSLRGKNISLRGKPIKMFSKLRLRGKKIKMRSVVNFAVKPEENQDDRLPESE